MTGTQNIHFIDEKMALTTMSRYRSIGSTGEDIIEKWLEVLESAEEVLESPDLGEEQAEQNTPVVLFDRQIDILNRQDTPPEIIFEILFLTVENWKYGEDVANSLSPIEVALFRSIVQQKLMAISESENGSSDE